MGRKGKNDANDDGGTEQAQSAQAGVDTGGAEGVEVDAGGMELDGSELAHLEGGAQSQTTASDASSDVVGPTADATDTLPILTVHAEEADEPIEAVPTTGILRVSTRAVETMSDADLLDELGRLTSDPRGTFLPALRNRVEEAIALHQREVLRLDQMVQSARDTLEKANAYIHSHVQPRINQIKARLQRPE